MSSAPGRRRADRRGLGPLARRALIVVAVVLAVGLLAGGWLLVRGNAAKGHLADADRRTDDLRAAILDGRTDEARAALDDVQSGTSSARGLTSDPVWRLAGALPWRGQGDGVGHPADAAEDRRRVDAGTWEPTA